MNKLMLGADPEVFLRLIGTDIFVPGIGIVGGTKEEPIPVNNGALQEDNVTAEFNVNPTSDPDEFSYLVHDVMGQLSDKVAGSGMEVCIQASAEFGEEMLYDPRAVEIGCDPDFNAYTQEENNYKVNYFKSGIRYAGGHIHLGSKDIVNQPHRLMSLVKYMDLHVGGALALIDEDEERIKHYGRAGNYRVKPYGLEYRTSSNVWLKDKDLTRDVSLLTKRAFEQWLGGVNDSSDFSVIAKAINSKDKDTLSNTIPVTSKRVIERY